MRKDSVGFKPTCKEIHRLASEGLDRKLTLVERIRMQLHLLVCTACTNFNGQMQLLRQAMRKMPLSSNDSDEQNKPK